MVLEDVARLLVLAVLLSGCSIALQSKPAKGVARSTSGCSTTHAYWIADAVGVVASAAAVAYALSKQGDAPSADGAAGAAGGVVGVLYLASAGNGYRWRSQCAAETAAVTASR